MDTSKVEVADSDEQQDEDEEEEEEEELEDPKDKFEEGKFISIFVQVYW